ncbi:aminopeptidase N [Kordiimonas lacus]|uniref:Aminopeptidase N n=1 Tax=Kordiimonas lacus TaxID=637679 RepID=A0A1G6W115_9PROT|nr:aminopeptidase N [Kordiimonas lacus]SDD59403.1 aminopeptidase N [Kordiimonas lacus]
MDVRSAASAPKQEIRLEDYKAPVFTIDKIDLTFRLHDDHAEVEARSLFKMHGDAGGALQLDGGPFMDLLALEIDGQPVPADQFVKSADFLQIRAVPKTFELGIITKVYPKQNTRLEGLYFSGGNFCTQCEAEGFRHITYFPDRPDVLTRYMVRVEADKESCPVLLSNGNPKESGDLENGRHFAVWDDPHLKPSYLFALVAGDLACQSDSFRTASGRHVELNIFVAERDLDKCDYAMQSLKRAMVWDEEEYGLEYDLDVYNIVAVSDFNMGAMENKGLNVFNTKYVLASPETATDADFDHVEGVIGHEYFHNWTGNRVTCRDWFQLSLKEGLTVFRDQEFSSDMTSRAVKRLDDVRVLRMLQYPEDAGPLAHPVRPEKYIEINNFYTTTVYNKGAEVIRMMHCIIGPEAFRKGMDLYFERHDGQAATCEDFATAMEDASGVDLKQFRLWYSQAGTPKVVVRRERDGEDLILTFEQSCGASPGQALKLPYHMPVRVGLIGPNGGDVKGEIEGDGVWSSSECVLHLRNARQSFRFRNVPEGTVPSILRGFSAPVVLDHDLSDDELAFLAVQDSDAFVRWEASQDLFSRHLVKQVETNGVGHLPELLQQVFVGHLEDKDTDPALIAELLALPSEIALGQKLDVLMPERVHVAREALAKALAGASSEKIIALYHSLTAGHGYTLDQSAKAARRLRNMLLTYIALLPDGEAIIQAHYAQADNMTDCMAALTLIAHSDFAFRDQTLADFYSKWQKNDLVIDKWFAVQAQSKRPDTVARVRALTEHEAFTFNNPNRLRSLISTYSMLNQVRFHEKSGEGYRFLGEMIAKVDEINPQTAARLVAPLGRWGRVEEPRRGFMKDALTSVLKAPNLSDDVRELVEKSLA